MEAPGTYGASVQLDTLIWSERALSENERPLPEWGREATPERQELHLEADLEAHAPGEEMPGWYARAFSWTL